MRIILIVLFLLNFVNVYSGARIPNGRLYCILIGIDSYNHPFKRLAGCVIDANNIEKKLSDDYLFKFKTNNVISIKLINENACLDSVKAAFAKVATEATPDDYFVFLFSGFSIESPQNETYLVLANQSDSNIKGEKLDINFYRNYIESAKNIISLQTLSKWMELISCRNQMIITEAGNGKMFSQNLILNLFENNPIIALDSSRNRIIVTTNGLGMDGFTCRDQNNTMGGPLCYFLTKCRSIFDAFTNISSFEYDLIKNEIFCSFRNTIYSRVYTEKDYLALLVNRSSGSRGAAQIRPTSAENNKHRQAQNFALLVATNTYNEKSGWMNLKNPINDANEIAKILEDKYGYKVHILFNAPKDTILKTIFYYKELVSENDNFIFFVAGHGYFDVGFSDGYIVTNDSKSLDADFSRDSYLQLGTLNRILDAFPAKHIFTIIDICFGASFEINARNLAISDYSNQLADINLQELMARKKDEKARIFLASGKAEVPDYWSSSLSHSPFANKIIISLQKEKSFITPGLLYKGLEMNITQPVIKQFGSHSEHADFFLIVK